MQVGTSSNIDIALAPDTKALEEIVVVGYGTQKKATVTGAISGIKGDAIAQVRRPIFRNRWPAGSLA